MTGKRVLAAGLLVVIIAVLVALPLFVKKESNINLAIMVGLYVSLASSWNILGGYTGQTSLGHAAFFGLGTLVTRLLWLSTGLPLPLSILAGALVAVIFSLIIGAPAFKLRGAYFAIGTLALGQVLYVIVGDRWPMITSLPAAQLATYSILSRYYVFLAFTVLTIAVAYLLVNSRFGLGMMAVREEEDAAESLGVSALRHKLLALGVSSFLAGLVGGAFAFYHVGYYPQLPFGPLWSFDAVTIAFIGGTGTIIGPIIGGVFFVLLRELLAVKLVEIHLTVFGTLFVLVVLFLPGGLVEAWSKTRDALARRFRKQQGRPLPQEAG
ncbi:MAG: branched-chain amino acid ABC transporter permease [Anaerolineae bacterium]|nr:branched-chain amino acid ABC transporter permease [Anaerolineae bacterium]